MRTGPSLIVALATFIAVPHLVGPSLAPRAAEASTSIELSVDELVTRASLVMAGTPLESTSLWEDSEGARGRRIVTYTKVRVDRVIDGAPRSDVWVRTLGGHVGDIGQHVEGEAVLIAGRPAVLFLRELAEGPHAVVGMAQGHYPLDVPTAGSPERLLSPQAVGRLVGNVASPVHALPARSELVGRTLDQVAELVAAVRRAHAR